MAENTIILKCPKCGHFMAELGNFVRARCCGYEIIVTNLREDALTTSKREPTLAPTTK